MWQWKSTFNDRMCIQIQNHCCMPIQFYPKVKPHQSLKLNCTYMYSHVTANGRIIIIIHTSCPGTVDQKNPLQSGSSNMYGTNRVNRRTQFKTANTKIQRKYGYLPCTYK